jgi:DNA-binding IscR family transcriptional regulator
MTHELWATLNFKLYEYLTSVTLSDLVEKHLQKSGAEVSILHPVRRVGPSPRGKSMTAMA